MVAGQDLTKIRPALVFHWLAGRRNNLGRSEFLQFGPATVVVRALGSRTIIVSGPSVRKFRPARIFNWLAGLRKFRHGPDLIVNHGFLNFIGTSKLKSYRRDALLALQVRRCTARPALSKPVNIRIDSRFKGIEL